MEEMSPLALGVVGSLLAGAMTAVGASPVLLGQIPSRATRDLALGFAAGVMLAASFFSLIIPALDAAGPASRTTRHRRLSSARQSCWESAPWHG